MPTTRTVTVKSSGGDYTSLNAAFAGEIGDLVTLDRLLVIDCYNFQDTTVADMGTGWTTDATRYVTVQAVNNHNGLYGGTSGTSAYSIDTGGAGAGIFLRADYTRIIGLSLKGTFGGLVLAPNCLIKKCIFIGDNAFPTRGCSVGGGGTGAHFENCLGIADDVFIIGADGCSLYNCTAKCTNFSAFNVNVASGSLIVKNCLAVAAGTSEGGFYIETTGTWHADCTNCASDDTTSPSTGSGHRTSQTFTFVNAGANDYHIQSSDAGAKGFGADLSADASFPFSTDWEGTSRGATWDIGADQVTVTPDPPLSSPVGLWDHEALLGALFDPDGFA